ncbi:MAG TPA: hypothetical protein VFX70_07630 [Mycobacteriales bacterium]|nr:hypothetical protein [Mycobacteriales bacterium]
MVVLGLLLLAAATVLAVAVITSNTGVVSADLWGLTVTNMSLGAIFAVGMIAAVVGLLGLMILLGGARRSRRRRRDRRALARDHRRLAAQAETARPEPGADVGGALPDRNPAGNPGKNGGVAPGAPRATRLPIGRFRGRHRRPVDTEPT